jgi:hypothetical protein
MSFRGVLYALSTLFYIVLYFVFGGLVIASFYTPGPRYILGALFLIVAVPVLIFSAYDNRKLRREQEEYRELQIRHGAAAREHCPHRRITLSQNDIGVLVMTDKWCQICGAHLGPARLKESIFGNKWE